MDGVSRVCTTMSSLCHDAMEVFLGHPVRIHVSFSLLIFYSSLP